MAPGALRIPGARTTAPTSHSPFGSGRSFTSGCPIALTVQDPVGLGEESLVALRTGYIPGPFNFNTVTYALVRQRQDTAGNWTSTILFYDSSRENQRPVECQMVAVDDDRDGREELQVVVGHQRGWTNNQFAPRAIRLAFDENGAVRRWQANSTFASYSLGARTFALVGGDDDGATVTVRWTGQKEVALSDPMTLGRSTDTEYAATIGDIANNGVDYPNWNDAAGLVVYQDRTTADVPFQVMRYWVDPIGVGY